MCSNTISLHLKKGGEGKHQVQKGNEGVFSKKISYIAMIENKRFPILFYNKDIECGGT